ncbi:MAG: tRNA guanosine(34) transglycosylase Tgt, partial [Candidatus Buchananbacteria bacterium CG10_big_fil_rev_8_21_14_0_10_42_9]
MTYFKIVKKSKKSKARLTKLTTKHGEIAGPFFMPIATRGAVKNVSVDEMMELGAQILLSNTYHLLLEPGMAVMKKASGLHQFMNWPGPILTDSGGYQVFSLGKHRKITEHGVYFADPKNGNKYFLTPERAVQIQSIIGADIMMVLDECPPYPCSKKYAKESLELTTGWAKRCLAEKKKLKNKNLLFGIVQGSTFKDLRTESARQLTAMNFDGFAIGGVAVGEPRQKMAQVLKWVEPLLPPDKPRYLMGLGRPEELVMAVKNGMDMFDCVIPTREARHGRLYVFNFAKPNINSKSFYKTI